MAWVAGLGQHGAPRGRERVPREALLRAARVRRRAEVPRCADLHDNLERADSMRGQKSECSHVVH